MATTYKVLGQVNPTTASPTTLYTVPGATQAIVSTINVVNTGGATDTVSIAIRPAGETLDLHHYIVYGLSLSPTATFTYTGGITLSATDVITVISSTYDSTFNAFGSEIA